MCVRACVCCISRLHMRISHPITRNTLLAHVQCKLFTTDIIIICKTTLSTRYACSDSPGSGGPTTHMTEAGYKCSTRFSSLN